MKILHCADLHLDSKLTANLDKEQIRSRRAEILHTFESMVDYASWHDIHVILIAGDMFDTKNISALVRNTVLATINKHNDIDFYYLRGNHDTDNFLANLEEVPSNLFLFDSSWSRYDIGNVSIYGIELDESNSNSAYVSLMPEYDRFNIVMLHGQEAEGASKDKAEVINLKQLRDKNIDYLALGHIHAYKKEELDRRGIYCYPGCLEGRGFDECGDHGFVVIDINEDNGHFTHEFVDFAYRKLYWLKVDISECMSSIEIVEAINDVLRNQDISSRSMLRIELVGQVDIDCEKDIDYIKEHINNAYYYVKVKDNSKLYFDESDYIHDESLKGEFIRCVLNREDISKEDQASIIRYGIQILSGEEV